MESAVSSVTYGDSRLMALEVKSQGIKLLFINTYLSCVDSNKLKSTCTCTNVMNHVYARTCNAIVVRKGEIFEGLMSVKVFGDVR